MAADAKTQVRAGCYLRISSDPDDKRNGVLRQREDTAALCEVKGWVVAGYYEDNDKSASNGKKRPRWGDLLADIAAGKIDAIAAWDQDRNWRMMHELEDLRRFFGSLGREVKLATTGQGEIDLYSPSGVMQAQLKTLVSEHETAMMRIRQLRAARQRAEQGKPKWRRAFGYLPYTGRKEDDTGVRQIDETVQQRVVDAYTAVVKGDMTITAIAKAWNAAGVMGLNGKPWLASTLSLFLRSPRNAGLRDHNGQIVMKDGQRVQGTWEALVDVDLWDAAQSVMNTPERLRVKSVQEHLLTGVLRCGRTKDAGAQCNGSMGGQWIRQAGSREAKRDLITYRCRVCSGVAVRAEDVEPVVIGALVKRLSRPDAVKLLRKRMFDPAEAAKLRNEEAVLLGRLNEIAVERGKGLIDGVGYQIMRDTINDELAELENRRQDAERKRVLDDIPLGTDGVATKIEQLSQDRLRAVFNALMTVTVLPVGSGHKVFNKERIDIAWKNGKR